MKLKVRRLFSLLLAFIMVLNFAPIGRMAQASGNFPFLAGNDIVFESVEEGYSSVPSSNIRIRTSTKKVSNAKKALKVELEGENADKFELNGEIDAVSIPKNSPYTLPISVSPKTGLSAGTYIADIVLYFDANESGSNWEKVDGKKTVTFTVVSSASGTENETCVISFSAGDGGTGTKGDEIVDKGSSYTLPSKDTFTAPEHHILDWWKVSTASDTIYKNPGDEITITEDTEITAIWSNPSIIIYYYYGVMDVFFVNYSKAGESYTIAPYSSNWGLPENKHFAGWVLPDGTKITKAEIDAQKTIVAPTENLKFTAYYEDDPVSQDVTFKANGGKFNIDGEEKDEYVVNLLSGETIDEAAVPLPKFEGYKFEGWYLDQAYEIPFDFSAPITPNVTTIYAKWEADYINVSFKANGGKFDINGNEKEEYDIALIRGETVTPPNVPILDGYKFDGWYADALCSVVFDFDEPISEDTNIYAGWKAYSTQHKVKIGVTTLDINGIPYAFGIGFDGGKASVNVDQAEKGETITVDVSVNDGYKLKEIVWGDIVDKKGDITDTKSFIMPDYDVVIDVYFQARDSFDIFYDANGGTKGEYWDDVRTYTLYATIDLGTIRGDMCEGVVEPPAGKEFAGIEWDGVTYHVGEVMPEYKVTKDITVKYLWKDKTIVQEPPVIKEKSFKSGIKGAKYSAALEATGDGPIKWSVVKGSLPAGLSLSEDGKIAGTPTEGGSYTFTVKAANEQSSAEKEFTIDIYYSIVVEVNPANSGLVEVKSESGKWAKEIDVNRLGGDESVCAKANEGYKFKHWADGNDNVVSIANPYSFTLNDNIALVAVFEEKTYSVTIANSITGGTVSVDKMSDIHEGEVVTLTAAPDEGYELSELVVKDEWNESIAVSNNKFIMPAGDVSVEASFKKKIVNVTFNAN